MFTNTRTSEKLGSIGCLNGLSRLFLAGLPASGKATHTHHFWCERGFRKRNALFILFSCKKFPVYCWSATDAYPTHAKYKRCLQGWCIINAGLGPESHTRFPLPYPLYREQERGEYLMKLADPNGVIASHNELALDPHQPSHLFYFFNKR